MSQRDAPGPDGYPVAGNSSSLLANRPKPIQQRAVEYGDVDCRRRTRTDR